MSPVQSVKTVLRKYVKFSGRARRSEFWWFYLFSTIVSIISTGLDVGIFGAGMEDPTPISTIIGLALLLPTLAVTVRRLHDIDRTGWWVLLSLIPVVGWIILIVFNARDSGPHNRFGSSPKGPPATVVV